MKHALLQTLSLLAAASVTAVAGAQAVTKEPPYPTKPIRFVVPFPPGGTADIQARVLGERLAQRLGQQVMVDNRPGASGNIGMEMVARSPADGYTMVIAMVSSWAVNPHIYKLPYNVITDFAHIINVSTTPGVLSVHPSLPVKTVKDLIALARQKPGELTYGSSGIGGFEQMSAELFDSMAKVKMTHVPYKGAAPALVDLVGGHIQVFFAPITPTLPYIQSGRVRGLAITSGTRSDVLPKVPTIAESGVPGYENLTWSAIGAPARTPRPIVDRLNKELMAVLQTPEVKESFHTMGAAITGGTPEQCRDYLKSEVAKFGNIVKEAGIKINEGS